MRERGEEEKLLLRAMMMMLMRDRDRSWACLFVAKEVLGFYLWIVKMGW